jgi:hypothetical protein
VPSAPKEGTNWTVAGAKDRLSEVTERAVCTSNDHPERQASVVVVSAEMAAKTVRRGTLAEFLMDSPLRGAGLDLERQHDEPRDLRL